MRVEGFCFFIVFYSVVLRGFRVSFVFNARVLRVLGVLGVLGLGVSGLKVLA